MQREQWRDLKKKKKKGKREGGLPVVAHGAVGGGVGARTQLLVAEEVAELKRPRVPLLFFSLFWFGFSSASVGGGAAIDSGSRRFSWRRRRRLRWMMMAMTVLPVSSLVFFFLSLFSFSSLSRFFFFSSSLLPLLPALSSHVFIGKYMGREAYYPCPVVAQG
jgi:hypothetical protein